MTEITNQSLNEIIENVKTKKISSTDLTKAYIKNIESAKKLNAFVTTTFDQALDKAQKFDKKPNFDQLLPGIPLAVKDLFCTENIKTTAGSNILNNFIPSYESTVTKNLWNNGSFLLGKLNCDEFAMGSSNETSHYGNVINPCRRSISTWRFIWRILFCSSCRLNSSYNWNRYRWINKATSFFYRHCRL
jgi:aspartyl-tRNA(Asn)/glutamyl-tRNA(Gln) amidotransferase subunit A